MKNLVETRHTNFTISELCQTIEGNDRPIKRSPHVGNIQPKDLAVMAGLPKGVEVIMVNTIQGDDKITKPHVVQLGASKEVQLSSRNSARNRVVGSVAIRLTDNLTHALPVPPTIGRSVADYHMEALRALPLNNPPVDMMSHFNKNSDLLKAVAEACLAQGCLHRQVEHDGKITSGTKPDLSECGIYGIEDCRPSHTGALLPLSGMMALDMMMSAEAGSDETLHLGGGDMAQYTMDKDQMETVSSVIARASALLGKVAARHLYIVQDCRGLAVAVPEVSQHELLLNGRVIDLSEHLNRPCGESIND